MLKESRVVILGEPGSGKTWELRERAKMWVAQKEFAFFIRLDQLANRDLSIYFSDEERRRFANWKQSTTPAYFFLDSVDEAKFRKLSDFYSTLERFARELGDSLLRRAKILLSSRISEWKPFVEFVSKVLCSLRSLAAKKIMSAPVLAPVAAGRCSSVVKNSLGLRISALKRISD